MQGGGNSAVTQTRPHKFVDLWAVSKSIQGIVTRLTLGCGATLPIYNQRWIDKLSFLLRAIGAFYADDAGTKR